MQALFNLLVLNSLFHYDANQINGKKKSRTNTGYSGIQKTYAVQ